MTVAHVLLDGDEVRLEDDQQSEQHGERAHAGEEATLQSRESVSVPPVDGKDEQQREQRAQDRQQAEAAGRERGELELQFGTGLDFDALESGQPLEEFLHLGSPLSPTESPGQNRFE